MTVAGTIGVLSGPALALQVTRAMAIMALAECRRDHAARLEFPLTVAPWFGFGAAVGHFSRGTVIANAVFLAPFVAIAFAGGAAVVRLSPAPAAGRAWYADTARLIRFPGVLAVAFAFVIGGMASGGVGASVHSDTPGVDVPLVLFVAFVTVATAAAATRSIHRATAGELTFEPTHAVRGPPPGQPLLAPGGAASRWAHRLLLGNHAWLSAVTKDAGCTPTATLGIMFSRYRGTSDSPTGRLSKFFFPIELLVTVVVAGAVGVLPLRCDWVAVVVTAATGAVLLVTVACRPYIIATKNVTCVCSNLLAFIASVLVCVAVTARMPAADATALARAGARAAVASTYFAVVSGLVSAARFLFLFGNKARIAPRAADGADGAQQLFQTLIDYGSEVGAASLRDDAALELGGEGAGDDGEGAGDAIEMQRVVEFAVQLAVTARWPAPPPGAEAEVDAALALGTDDDSPELSVFVVSAAENADAADTGIGVVDSADDGGERAALDAVLFGSPAAVAAAVEYTDEGRRLRDELVYAMKMTTDDVLNDRHKQPQPSLL
jgi:hypothetical protein